ncbi:MAG: glutamyl-tRNA reductase [Acidimicrobiaceae bacterium]|nr:glutamyl-tRNA reductase [Acidimicrobiaceae bacterium]
MSVVVVGLNHRTAPLRLLETMSVAPEQLPKALHDLTGRDHLAEVAVLSTCNRTEVYAVATRFHAGMLELRNFLSGWSGQPPEAFGDDVYSFYDESAVGHLFKVAAGLDSAVLGEGEILRQVREAWDVARDEGCSGPVLDLLFRQAVETGKRVRSETTISRGTTSLSHAAVALAAAQAGNLSGAAVGVLGAGEMAESMIAALRGPFAVANRTDAKASDLAARFSGQAVAWADRGSLFARADVLLTSTGSTSPVLSATDLAPVMAARPDRPLVIVDLAVPRDVDPSAATVPGVTLLDMDDVRAQADLGAESRRAEVPRAEAIVGEEVARYLDAANQRQVSPLLGLLHDRGEAIRIAELARLDGRLGALDPRQRRAVDAVTRGIVAKLLHDPTVRLKAAAGTPQGEQLAAALRQLFEL